MTLNMCLAFLYLARGSGAPWACGAPYTLGGSLRGGVPRHGPRSVAIFEAVRLGGGFFGGGVFWVVFLLVCDF